MNKITITLNDANKIDELLNLVAALPYVESARFEESIKLQPMRLLLPCAAPLPVRNAVHPSLLLPHKRWVHPR